ncbi:MAG TPA: zf-HC2 domain-containing protein, partial [Planctomycetes bacterium]|nr:zf-HC2 domain-containing protein [Planctomycetota bacterium]
MGAELMSASACPSRDEIARYLAGRLDDVESQQLLEHIETCAGCEAALDTMDRASPGVPPRTADTPAEVRPSPSRPACRQWARAKRPLPPPLANHLIRHTYGPAIVPRRLGDRNKNHGSPRILRALLVVAPEARYNKVIVGQRHSGT